MDRNKQIQADTDESYAGIDSRKRQVTFEKTELNMGETT